VYISRIKKIAPEKPDSGDRYVAIVVHWRREEAELLKLNGECQKKSVASSGMEMKCLPVDHQHAFFRDHCHIKAGMEASVESRLRR